MSNLVKFGEFNPVTVLLEIYFLNSADPDQLASSEASWSGSTLFYIHTMINYVIVLFNYQVTVWP